MKKPSKFDVFCKTNLVISKSRIINGNLYVKGDIQFKNIAKLEVFGDVVVDGDILDGSIIVHGNLECNELCNVNTESDGNIYIAHAADFLVLKSNHGQITINGSASGMRIKALGGSIKITNSADLTYIEAFDEINIGENIIAKTIIAGDGLKVGDSIINSSNYGKLKISIYNGGLHSKNLNIN